MFEVTVHDGKRSEFSLAETLNEKEAAVFAVGIFFKGATLVSEERKGPGVLFRFGHDDARGLAAFVRPRRAA